MDAVINAVKNSFTIKNLETISGIKSHTIRIWEKRYKLLQPKRTSTNIRRYDLDNFKKLLNIALLIKNGYKISKIANLTLLEIENNIKEITIKENSETIYINSFKLSMISFDTSLFYKTFNEIIKIKSFEFIYMNVFLPLMKELGILWQTGSVSASHEHFITNLIKQKIHVHTEILSKTEKISKSNFVLFLPENEFHELSILFLNYWILSNGHNTIFLGQSIPNADLMTILNKNENIHFVSFFTVEPNKDDIFNYLNDFEDNLLKGNQNQLSLFGPQIFHIKDDIRWERVNLFFSLDEFKDKFFNKKVYS